MAFRNRNAVGFGRAWIRIQAQPLLQVGVVAFMQEVPLLQTGVSILAISPATTEECHQPKFSGWLGL